MAKQGFQTINSKPYIYQEVDASTSTAMGIDTADSGKFKININSSSGAAPGSGAQITIDPGTNGNITLDPTGSGSVLITGLTTGVVQSDSSGTLSSSKGTDGQLLIGSSAGAPIWSTLTAGVGVSITNGANSITIDATGASAISTINGNSGSITPTAGAVTISGTNNITTTGSGSTLSLAVTGTTDHAVQVGNGSGSLTSLSVGTSGQVLVGSTGANPSFITPTAGTGLSITTNATTLEYALSTPVSVANGGTGKTSLTAYAVLCGGTTSTGAIQSIASVGTSGQVLTSNGAGALPTFQTPTSGITTLNGNTGSATGTTVTLSGTKGIQTSGSGSTMTFSVEDANQNIVLGSSSYNTSSLRNTGAGYQVFNSLGSTATDNTAIGNLASRSITSGTANTVVGGRGGYNVTTGTSNACVGYRAGYSITTGSYNTVVGTSALDDFAGSLTGSYNTIIGGNSCINLTTTDSSNIAIGYGVNISAATSNMLQIGAATGTGNGQLNKAIIHGIYGKTVGGTNAAVLIDNDGVLGTTTSSIRFKENVQPMGDQSNSLMHLRPVTFNYKEDKEKHKQYGLIAEEVADWLPDLVNYDEEGKPFNVKYHDLPALLLNELQKQHLYITTLIERIEALERRVL